eukprot:m.45584 g.45584  ORF g.45584 m.45584 type:complete len:180 (-) comp7228_c0_seq2:1070-1609(-)
MYPPSCKSIQLASYNFGPTIKRKSPIFPSSRTRVAVRPSLQRAGILVNNSRNVFAGTVCTSSKIIRPQSLSLIQLIIFFASSERLAFEASMEYVAQRMQFSGGFDLSELVNLRRDIFFKKVTPPLKFARTWTDMNHSIRAIKQVLTFSQYEGQHHTNEQILAATVEQQRQMCKEQSQVS